MNKIHIAFWYFILYRLLDLESVLWTATDFVRGRRAKVAMKLHEITHNQ